jgi:hypothetical protein
MTLKNFIIFFLFYSSHVYGQETDTFTNARKRQSVKRPIERNVIWFTPTRAKKINGLAIGTLPSSMFYENDSLHINGIHVETNPIILYLIPQIVIASLTSSFIREDSARYFPNKFPDSSRLKSDNSIYGLNISILGSGVMTKYKGLSISSVGTFGHIIKGISITIGQNNFYEFHGLLIAGLMNNVNKGSGLQIGLFNRCKECKGLQIGLLNKMGNRTLPFLNLRL